METTDTPLQKKAREIARSYGLNGSIGFRYWKGADNSTNCRVFELTTADTGTGDIHQQKEIPTQSVVLKLFEENGVWTGNKLSHYL